MASKKIAIKIEELKIYIDRDRAVVLEEPLQYTCNTFNSFRSLKAVELRQHVRTCEQHAESIYELISKVQSVKKFNVKSEFGICDINKIIDLAPHIKELGVANTSIKRLPVEMYKIVNSIRNRRAKLIAEAELDPKPFHLVVNRYQWRELQDYKDVKTILSTSMD